MRTFKTLFALVVAAIALTVPTGSLAGTSVDPNTHDFLFGVQGGLRYAEDTAFWNSDNGGFATAEAGCGDQSWHLIGGGASAQGAPTLAWLAFDRPNDYTDADSNPDDGFIGSGFGPPDHILSVYSICTQSVALSYKLTVVPNQSTSARTGSAMCPSGWHVTTGGVAIATGGSWMTTSMPVDGSDAGTVRDNGWRGTVHDTLNGSGGFYVSAICSRGVRLVYRNSPLRSVAPGQALSTTVTCYPKVEHVVGGGASVSGSADQARLGVTRPYDDGSDPDGIPDNGWQTKVFNLSGGSKTVATFAICLRS